MSRISTIAICVLVAFTAAGCFIRPRNMPVAPVPLTTLTPGEITSTVPWIFTATLATNTGAEVTTTPPAAEVTATPAVTSGPTLAATAVASDVKAILVKDDLRLRRGPGVSYDILGLVHAGMTLIVTGKSVDDAWWQVTCEQTPTKICWVSSDPELTEPAQTPP